MAKNNTQYTGQRAFAAALRISQPALNRLTQRDDWPVKRVGPWSEADRVAVSAWRASELQENRAAHVPTSNTAILTTARAAQAMERAKSTKFEREIKQQKFHDSDVCRQKMIAKILAVKTGLLNLAAKVSVRGAHATEERLYALVEDEVMSLLREFSGQTGPSPTTQKQQ